MDLSRVYSGQPLIPRGTSGAFDSIGAAAAAEVVTWQGQHWVFYLGCRAHHEELDKTPEACAIGVATYPLDRLSCLRGSGVIELKPFELRGTALWLNLKTEPNGYIATEVLDTAGRVIPGFSRQECEPATGDHSSHRATWRAASLARLVGTTVVVRLHLRGAALCAMRFAAA